MHVHIWSSNTQTGGPWALAQLGSALQDVGHKVSVSVPNDPVPRGADVLVAPEVSIRQLCAIRGPLRVLWWLSVENAYWRDRRDRRYDQLGPLLMGEMDKVIRYPIRRLLREPEQSDILHAVQSEYARIHVRSAVGLEPFMLTDYLTDLSALTAPIESGKRSRCVAYNPSKGMPATLRVMQALDGAVDFRPIKGLTHAETVNLLRDSLIYLDLGGHPGRDRIPREAALAGCIVLVGKRGAGKNEVDYTIPDNYKLPVPWRLRNARIVADRIGAIIDDPEPYLPPMRRAVQDILKQQDIFLHEVDSLADELRRRLEKNVAAFM